MTVVGTLWENSDMQAGVHKCTTMPA